VTAVAGRRAAVAVLAVVAVLLAGLAAVAAARASHRTAVRTAGDAALAAASQQVETVLSYDYRHLRRDFARAQAVLTPRFRKQYDDLTVRAVEPLAGKVHAISSATVTAAGVVSAAEDRATVLVFVAQTSTNTQLQAPRLDRPRINVSMVRSGGRWLIDDMKPI